MNTPVFQRPIHLGEMLKEEVEYRHTKQTELAEQMGISYKILNDILNGRRPLTTTTALLFETALGIDAGLLMRIQLDHNLQTAPKRPAFHETTAPCPQDGGGWVVLVILLRYNRRCFGH